MAKTKIKKGDEVMIMRGKNRGKQGKVLQVLRQENRVIVEGMNMIKRHSRPTQQMKQGGIIEKEAPIHRSNVKLVSSGEKA